MTGRGENEKKRALGKINAVWKGQRKKLRSRQGKEARDRQSGNVGLGREKVSDKGEGTKGAVGIEARLQVGGRERTKEEREKLV